MTRRALALTAVAVAALLGPASASAATGTQTTLTCKPSPATVGAAASCTAQVDSLAPPGFPSGMVTLSAAGPGGSFSATSCELAALTGSTLCKVAYTPAAPGTHFLLAAYEGDDDFEPSQGQASLEAIAAPAPKKKCKKGFTLKKVKPKKKGKKPRKKCVRVKKKKRKR